MPDDITVFDYSQTNQELLRYIEPTPGAAKEQVVRARTLDGSEVARQDTLANILTSFAALATHAKQDAAKSVLDNLLTGQGALATHAKQDDAKGVLDNILLAFAALATHAKQDAAKGVLDNLLTGQGTLATHAKQDLAKGVLDNILTAAGLLLTEATGNATKTAAESIATAVNLSSLVVKSKVPLGFDYGSGVISGGFVALSGSNPAHNGIVMVGADPDNTDAGWLGDPLGGVGSGLPIVPGNVVPVPTQFPANCYIFGTNGDRFGFYIAKETA